MGRGGFGVWSTVVIVGIVAIVSAAVVIQESIATGRQLATPDQGQ